MYFMNSPTTIGAALPNKPKTMRPTKSSLVAFSSPVTKPVIRTSKNAFAVISAGYGSLLAFFVAALEGERGVYVMTAAHVAIAIEEVKLASAWRRSDCAKEDEEATEEENEEEDEEEDWEEGGENKELAEVGEAEEKEGVEDADECSTIFPMLLAAEPDDMA